MAASGTAAIALDGAGKVFGKRSVSSLWVISTFFVILEVSMMCEFVDDFTFLGLRVLAIFSV